VLLKGRGKVKRREKEGERNEGLKDLRKENFRVKGRLLPITESNQIDHNFHPFQLSPLHVNVHDETESCVCWSTSLMETCRTGEQENSVLW
jgi:hypothetical protein